MTFMNFYAIVSHELLYARVSWENGCEWTESIIIKSHLRCSNTSVKYSPNATFTCTCALQFEFEYGFQLQVQLSFGSAYSNWRQMAQMMYLPIVVVDYKRCCWHAIENVLQFIRKYFLWVQTLSRLLVGVSEFSVKCIERIIIIVFKTKSIR